MESSAAMAVTTEHPVAVGVLAWGGLRVEVRERPLILRSLASIQEKLDPQIFFRANRSQIVNLRAIDRVDDEIGGRIVVTMPRGIQVQISRRRSSRLKEFLSL